MNVNLTAVFASTDSNKYNSPMAFMRRGPSDSSDPSEEFSEDHVVSVNGRSGDHTLTREMAEEDIELLNLVDDDEGPRAKRIYSSPGLSELQGVGRGRSEDRLGSVFRNDQALPRLMATWRQLDIALDGWWTEGEYPPRSVLRDGLMLLEAGYMLEESHCSLLLRGALHQERGMLTALKYQTDPERTALVIHEELVNADPTMSLDLLRKIIDEDENSAVWAPFLRSELLESLRRLPAEQREHALDALSLLSGAPVEAPMPTDLLFEEYDSARPLHWLQPALSLILLAGLIAGAILWRQERSKSVDMVQVPAASYVLVNADGSKVRIRASTYTIDRFEVTNYDYRRCITRNGCPPLTSGAGAGRDDYALNAAFDRYPVVNVTWDGAAAYCNSRGKRLPSEEEWRIAASFAPATERTYRYPWGDQFEPTSANTAVDGIGDTQQVGHYSPIGNSPFRAADMAGNVAEWTSSRVDDGSDQVWLKGGSFLDDETGVTTTARSAYSTAESADWIGFRCVATPLWGSLFD